MEGTREEAHFFEHTFTHGIKFANIPYISKKKLNQ